MVEIFRHTLIETLTISSLVFIALVLMDIVYVYSRGKFSSFLKKRPSTQYIISALLGAIPGCEGAYFAISLHTHGLISFGALLSAFIATSGDEAYVMFSKFPMQAAFLTLILLLLGYLIGWLTDVWRSKVNRGHPSHCETEIFHPTVTFSMKHYLVDHLWAHLIKKHMIKIILWTFAALFIIEAAISYYDLKALISSQPYVILLGSALIGLIPQSGPHLIFVAMYAEQAIPFSILFTSMFVQSGHALLPLLSVSLRDSVQLKLIAMVLGLLLGSGLFILGI